MSDVAAHAGVSTMTVSRAMKQGASVSASTRARILAAIEELGYVPDQSAGSLSSKRTAFVAAIVPSLNNSNFADTARGLTDSLEGAGLQLLLGYSDYSLKREEQLVEAMLRRRPEAVVLTGGQHTPRARKLLEQAGIPIVETWDVPKDPLDHVVGFSNSEAAAELVRYLYGKGHTKLAFIGGATDRDARGLDRRLGFERAVHDLGLGPPRIIALGDPPSTMQQGSEALHLLASTWPDTEAVVCVSDPSAFGVLTACQRLGWSVPERLAIAGFGDFEISACSHPAITTLHVDCYNIGQCSGELIARAIEAERTGSTLAPQAIITPYQVVARESA